MKHRLFVVAFVLALARSQSSRPTRQSRTSCRTLASDRFGGRLTGTRAKRSREFIVAELLASARSRSRTADFAVPFEFTAGTRDGGSISRHHEPPDVQRGFRVNRQARALSFSDNGDVRQSVFAGWHRRAPTAGLRLRQLRHARREGRVVLVPLLPRRSQKTKRRPSFALWTFAPARRGGAPGMARRRCCVVTGPHSPNAGELAPMAFDRQLPVRDPGPQHYRRRRECASRGARTNARRGAEALDSGTHVAGFPRCVRATVRPVRETRAPATTSRRTAPTASSSPAKPWVALGAQYHLGHGESGSSYWPPDKPAIHGGGADDNASGTAAVHSRSPTRWRNSRANATSSSTLVGRRAGPAGSATLRGAKQPIPIGGRIEAYSASTWSAACRTTSSTSGRAVRAPCGTS